MRNTMHSFLFILYTFTYLVKIILSSNSSFTQNFKTFKDNSNLLKDLKISEIKKMLGFKTLIKQKNNIFKRKTKKIFDIETQRKINNLPKNFIFTEKWPLCGSYVKSQGYCASCWAFSAVEVLQDRYCIKKGFRITNFSVQELISCDFKNYNCLGGDIEQAWKYLSNKGTVTEKCFPYFNKYTSRVKSCNRKCYNGQNKYYIRSKGYKRFNNSDEIKLEIYTNGPIMTGFEVYLDFFKYKSGIYTKDKNALFLGGHAVKIIGWGFENGINFWVAKNTWGSSWGENGFFRFKMDHCCQFEENGITGFAY